MLFGLWSLPESIYTLSKTIKKGESDETIGMDHKLSDGVYGVCDIGLGGASVGVGFWERHQCLYVGGPLSEFWEGD
jgi:hypothetical protein